jgi:trimeric autotransporter adhesin
MLFLVPAKALAQTATITALQDQSCAGTRFGSNLNCTSNDFSSNLTFDQPSTNAIANCIAGETVTIDVLAAITSNSPLRYDGGYFIGQNGIDPKLNNTGSSCSLGVFPNTPTPFLNSDSDSCGDFQASSSATLLIEDVKILCKPVTGSNVLAIPYVLVFNNQSGSTACTPANITANTTAKCLSSTTASVTGVTVNGYVTLTKQTSPDTEPGTFSFTATESGGATVTPANFTLADNGSQTIQVPFTSTGGGRTLVITEAALGGWSPTASITCATPSGGAASYVTVNNSTRTITATLTTTNFGAVCTITNTRMPRLTLSKTTLGGAGGPFAFSVTNLDATPSSITTTVAGTPVATSSGAVQVTTIGTAVTVTENFSVPYFLSGVSCSDANSARTGSIGTFGTYTGNVLTIPASRIVAGANISCTLSNTLYTPALTIVKAANTAGPVNVGDVITYTYTVTNTGNATISNVTIADVHDGGGTPPVPSNEVLLTDTAPTGDSVDAATNAIWDSLAPGDTIRFSAAYTVVQADIDHSH